MKFTQVSDLSRVQVEVFMGRQRRQDECVSRRGHWEGCLGSRIVFPQTTKRPSTDVCSDRRMTRKDLG